MTTGTTRVVRRVNAPPARVYRALLDPGEIEAWRVPDGMASRVHELDPREGGRFRVSLTYEEPTGSGKTTAHTDTYHGYFAELVPDERVVEVLQFETGDPAMRGEMRITCSLVEVDGGTEVHAVHEGVPAGVSAADNELGWRMALDRLAALVGGADPSSR